LIGLVALEALINRVRECSLWRDLYALHDKSLIRVKQVMKNHIHVEKANVLWYGPPCSNKKAQDEKPLERSHSPPIWRITRSETKRGK
jgi:hypothetical protein